MWYVRKGKSGALDPRNSQKQALLDAENLSIGSSWPYYVIHHFDAPNDKFWVIAKYFRGKKVPTPTVE